MGDGPVFKVISPEGDERRVAFTPPEMQIGSSLDSTLVLGGHGVSGKHCRISVRGERLIVADRGSKNGTYVNSRRCVEPLEFRPGDRLSVGAYVIEFAGDDGGVRGLEEKLRAEPVALARGEDEQRAAEQRRLGRYAREWVEQGRLRRLLLRGRDLTLAEGWMAAPAQRAEVEADPTLHEFVVASARAQRVRRALQLVVAGAALGAGAIFLASGRSGPEPAPEPPPPTQAPEEKVSEKTGPAAAAAREEWIEHQVSPGETLDDIARYYEVSSVLLPQWNPGVKDPPAPGTRLRVLTTRPPRSPLVEEYYTVGEGEDWRSVADRYNTTVDKLRRFNPGLGERLKGGEELTLWIDAGQFGTPNADDLPIFILPQGSSSVGGVTSGSLFNPVQLLPSPLAHVRCASHAYATNYTLSLLLRGISEFRAQGYDGEVMIADLSLKEGGGYGHHKSHQSGRDADIWLLVKRKQFRKGCNNCSTDRCRPDPEEVDWRATWRFIRALHATGGVQEIFLSHHLQAELRTAALAEGESEQELKELIQYPRRKGTPALVMHSDGHIHHIHVRFKCDPNDAACSNAK